MAMNRIQFQRGMSLFEHFQQFGTEAQCEAALERMRWPDGFRCPNCGGAAHCVLRGSARKTFQCNTCHHRAICAAAFSPDLVSIVEGQAGRHGGFFTPSRTPGSAPGLTNATHSQ